MHDPSKTNQKLLKNNSVLKEKIMELEQLEIKYKQAEEALRERKKKLNFLYSLADFIESTDSIEELFQKIANQIPFSWYYPEDACARIILKDQEFKTTNFRETEWRISADIIVHDQSLGVVEVYYPEKMPDGDEGLFLLEERDLINAVAERLGRVIERKQAEKSLKESEKKYRLLADNIHDVIFILDMNLNYTYISPSVKILRGYEPEEVFRHTPAETLTPSSMDLAMRTLSEIMEMEKSEHRDIDISRTLQLEMILKDGTTVWTEVKASLIRDETQRAVGIMGVTRDINERKKAEDALKNSEAKYRSIFENAVEGIYQSTIDGRFITANAAFARMSGYDSPEELIESIKDIETQLYVHPEDRKRFMEIREAKGFVEGFEVEFYKKDGSKFWVVINARTVKDKQGEILYFEGLIEDITIRKQAEEDLKQREEQVRLLLNSTAEAIYGIDLEGNCTFANPSCIRMLGYSNIEQLLGKNMHWLIHYSYPDGTQMAVEDCKIYRTFRKGEGEHVDDEVLWKADGTSFPVEYWSYPQIVNGKVSGAVVTFTDITERKRTENYREMGNDILKIFSKPETVHDSIQKVITSLKMWTGFDAVGIRLQDGDDFPYFSQMGFSNDFLMTENTLIERGMDSSVCRDKDGNVSLQCTCGLVISGKTDPTNPLFTKGGSFWTNDSIPLLDIPPDQDPRLHPRNKCIQQGYASFALVPIRNKDSIIGLIQFNDHRKNCFSLAVVEQFEGIAANIGEAILRTDAEEALRQNEEKYRNILETIQEAYFEVDLNGNFTFFNDSLCRLLGYSKEELISMNNRQYTDKEHSKKLFQAFNKVYNTGEPTEGFDWQIIKKDGTKKYVETSVSLQKDSSGKPNGFKGLVRDITERKHMLDELEAHHHHLEELVENRTAELAETMEKLKTNEERFGYALQASKDGIWDWNIKNKTSYCNPSYYRMLGYEPGELGQNAQNHWIDLLHPDERERIVAMTRHQLEIEGFYEIEFRMRTKDGGYKWILSHAKVVARDENGLPARVVGTHTDLTMRKQMEIELRNAYDTQQAIFESANTGIVLIRNHVILRCNHKAEEIFGFNPGELIGKTTHYWYEDDDTFVKMGREINEELAGQGIFNKERLLLRKDGTRFWARMAAQALHKSDISQGLVFIVEDITAERELTKSLRIAKDRAEMGSRAKDDLIANVSHELRTPMTTIREGVSQVLEGILGPTTEAQREFLGIVQKDTERLSRLINDLLDISKIEAGRWNLHKEYVDMTSIAKQEAMIFKSQADAMNLQIKTDFPESIIEAYVDSDKILQVWHNLINNALKFTTQGHIELSIKEQKNIVICTVKDTGKGMKTEDMPHIFDKFYQAAREIGPGEKGTGLGLAITKAIIEAHGGVLSVESIWGKGSIFIFEIPKAPL
jgi:PAS domain S-box-containing protein